ncbi:RE1-silencing transcription factor-like [Anthonomus grandis grandis]|uniref:RE1-silencing transcription factor-like n=1 Tax=Anthonomus grandis grandis TaxID=2921223 RepID=UPI0021661E2E|nr:RE1-silencing transcription factor-like [Anthonomus grandis grandis]
MKPVRKQMNFFEEFRNNYPKENKSLGIDVHGEEIIKNQINQLTSPASIAKYSCEQCSYSSPIKKSFKRHLQVHRDPEKWFYCGKCNYKTRQNGHLTRHQLTHKAISECNEIFICGICQYKFKQKCTLKRHILDTHGTHKKNYASQNDLPVFKCDSCPYSSIRRGLYLAHLDKHKDPKDVGNLYICDVCKFSTKYRRNLRVHLETHRDDVTKTIYECKICNFRSRLHYCLKRHLLSKKHLTVVGKSSEYCPREIRMKQEERDSDCEVKEFVETHEVKVEVYDEFEEVCKGVKVEPKEEEGFGVKVEC